MCKKKIVLVLDGDSRATLAVVRSLGRAGVMVTVASESSQSLAGSSKYCYKEFRYPSPFENTLRFAEFIRNLILDNSIDVLVPVTDATTYAILQHRKLFDNIVSLPLVPFETYLAASDKISLVKIAEKLDIPIPATIHVDPVDNQVFAQDVNIPFPVILKPGSSIQSQDDGLRKTSVRFASCKEELTQIVSSDLSFTRSFMIQEVIVGDGIGIFAFCNNGEIISVFSHHRIREKPPYGGVSVVCESTKPDSFALESSRKLLKALNWDGVVMVEFKRDNSRSGVPVLMEINARFWGSLQLAIDSGLNFPLYLYKLSQMNSIEMVTCFKQKRSRWLLGDLDHLIIRLKLSSNDSRYPQSWRDKFSAILIFFLEFFKGSIIEDFRYCDIFPFLYAVKRWIASK